MHIIDVAPGPSKQRENQEIISQVVRSADDDMKFWCQVNRSDRHDIYRRGV